MNPNNNPTQPPSTRGATFILLNGPSSSGKTSIGKAIKAISNSYLHVQYDTFQEMAYTAFYKLDSDGNNADLLRRAMHEFVFRMLSSGKNVVLDHVIRSNNMIELLSTINAPITWLVRVECSIEVLREREISRGDRQRGLAERQALTMHNDIRYDQLVDSTNTSPSSCAASILERLNEAHP